MGRARSAGSAAIVLLILTVLLAAHTQRERDCAIETRPEEGHDRCSDRGGPASAPAAHLAERTRTGLAGNLEDLIRQAASRSRRQMRVTPPPFEPRVVTNGCGGRAFAA